MRKKDSQKGEGWRMVLVTNLGMPGIGLQRETIKAVNGFLAGKKSAEDVEKEFAVLNRTQQQIQHFKGVDLVPVFDTDLYDRMLRHMVMFGLVPSRFDPQEASEDLSTYLALGEGSQAKNLEACAMRKWF